MSPTYINDSFFVLQGACDIQPSQLPLPALGGVNRGSADAAVNRAGLVVDELDRFLGHKSIY